MNEMKVFQKEEFGTVRTVVVNGEPRFVGKDIAAILGYSNTRDALAKHVEDEDKGVAKCDTLGGVQDLVVINESGLYSLILSSKLPNAKAFKHWVTSEVLPSIRKHGLYAIDEIIANPDMAIAALQALKAEREKNLALTTQVAMQEQQIAEMKPKVTYYDIVLQSPSLIKMSVIAKDYGMSPRAFNKLLHELRVQYKQGDIWLLYSKYQNLGYTSTTTYVTGDDKDGNKITKCWTKWTQKGRLFLYELLKQNGKLPLIELQDDSGDVG